VTGEFGLRNKRVKLALAKIRKSARLLPWRKKIPGGCSKTKLNLLEEEHGRGKQDLQNQRKSSSALDSELRIKEKEHATLQNKLGRLEEEIKDKEKVLQRSADLLEGEKGKTARLSERSRQQVQKRKSWKSM